MTPRDRWWRWQSRNAPYLFLLPFALVFGLFMAYPLGRSLILSFYKAIGPKRMEFVGSGNFRFLLHDWVFWWSVANTAAFTIAFLIVQIPLSLGLALLLNSRWVKARNWFRFAFFSTHLTGQVFVAIIFGVLLESRGGLVNHVLAALGIAPIGWLSDPNWIMVSVLIAALWLSVGFAMIYFLATLQGVDPEFYEAASVDGAGKLSKFWHVTLPSISKVLNLLIFMGIVAGLQLFELPYVLNQGPGPGGRGMTIVMYLFITGFDAGDLGYASAIGWMLVIMVAIVGVIQYRLLKRLGAM
ncbi:MAG TPA: sugar ABC transporter permease [Tepidisphaeraceae bacterium]|jgi:ABC-type sugar transport system permease subunit|nr:sugar ABC transporter permease [Tepidisphaeraceae bacterium]